MSLAIVTALIALAAPNGSLAATSTPADSLPAPSETSSAAATPAASPPPEASTSTSAALPIESPSSAGPAYRFSIEAPLEVSIHSSANITRRGQGAIVVRFHPFGGVTDDDGPRAFQPFLQHASTIEAGVRGSMNATDALGVTATDHFVSMAFGADIYLDRRLVIVGSVELGNYGQGGSSTSQATASTSTTINGWHSGGSIGVAFHGGDTRIDIGFRYVGDSRLISVVRVPFNAQSPFILHDTGGYAQLRTILARAVLLRLDAELFTDGFGVAAGGDWAITHDLTLGAGFMFNNLTRDQAMTTDTEIAGALSLAWWPSAEWKLRADYLLQSTDNSGADGPAYTHAFRFAAAFRW